MTRPRARTALLLAAAALALAAVAALVRARPPAQPPVPPEADRQMHVLRASEPASRARPPQMHVLGASTEAAAPATVSFELPDLGPSPEPVLHVEGFAPTTLPLPWVPPPEGVPSPYEVRLVRQAALRGRAVNAAGRSVALARVRVGHFGFDAPFGTPAHFEIGERRTDGGGRFSIDALPLAVTVWITTDRARRRIDIDDLAPGEDRDLGEIVLE